MAGITLEQAQARLDDWVKANEAVANYQSYTLSTANGGRTVTRVDASKVLEQITFWEQKVNQILRQSQGRARNRIYRAVPKDF